MEYRQEFDRNFMGRTLQLVKQYSGPYDATLLLNCLLGLLIVPKESSIDGIPEDPVEKLTEWGLSPSSIRNYGKRGKHKTDTLRGLVWSLRNSVAHFRFNPVHQNRIVTGFHFTDKSGFEAQISLDEIRVFVEKLANHLKVTLSK